MSNSGTTGSGPAQAPQMGGGAVAPEPAQHQPAQHQLAQQQPAQQQPAQQHSVHQHHKLRRTRVGGVWVAVALFALVLLLLLIFILQNGSQVQINFLGGHGHLPLGVALLLAAVLGVLLVVIPGSGRIMQLRLTARRHRQVDNARTGQAQVDPAHTGQAHTGQRSGGTASGGPGSGVPDQVPVDR